MFAQQYLQSQVTQRMRLAHAGSHPAEPAPAPGPTSVTAVLRRFELTTYLESVLRYTLSLPDTPREPWLRAYTRTIFLSGNPENLGTRFAFHYVSDDGSMAWTAPEDAGEHPPLRRLLRLFPTGELPALPAEVDVRARPRPAGRSSHAPAARLDVVVTRVSVADYLVHVHHALAESVLSGLIDASTDVTVRHVPQLDPAEGPYDMLRIVADRDADDGRLRAFAGITTSPGAGPVPLADGPPDPR